MQDRAGTVRSGASPEVPLRALLLLAALAGCKSSENHPLTFGYGSTGAPIVHDGLVGLWSYSHQITPYANVEVWMVSTWDTHANGVNVGLIQGEGLLYAGPSFTDDGMLLVPSNNELRTYTNSGVAWDTITVAEEGRISTAPAIAADGTAYVATEAGTVVAVRDGEIAWTADTPGTPFNRLAIGEDGAIFGFAAAVDEAGAKIWTAFGLDPDGSERWTAPLGVPTGSPALSREGKVLCTQNAAPDVPVPDPSKLELLALDPATGDTAWEAPLGLGGYSPVVLPNGTIAVAINSEPDQEGEVVYLSEDGEEKNRSDRLGWLGQPTLGTDGHLYLGCGTSMCVLNGSGGLADEWSIVPETEDYEFVDDRSTDLPPLLVDGRLIAVLDDGAAWFWDVGSADVEPGSWARNGGNDHGSGRVVDP